MNDFGTYNGDCEVPEYSAIIENVLANSFQLYQLLDMEIQDGCP